MMTAAGALAGTGRASFGNSHDLSRIQARCWRKTVMLGPHPDSVKPLHASYREGNIVAATG